MELFEFKGEDLTEDEDGGIIRRIRTRGEGYARPNDGAMVEGKSIVWYGKKNLELLDSCLRDLRPRVVWTKSFPFCEPFVSFLR